MRVGFLLTFPATELLELRGGLILPSEGVENLCSRVACTGARDTGVQNGSRVEHLCLRDVNTGVCTDHNRKLNLK